MGGLCQQIYEGLGFRVSTNVNCKDIAVRDCVQGRAGTSRIHKKHLASQNS